MFCVCLSRSLSPDSSSNTVKDQIQYIQKRINSNDIYFDIIFMTHQLIYNSHNVSDVLLLCTSSPGVCGGTVQIFLLIRRTSEQLSVTLIYSIIIINATKMSFEICKCEMHLIIHLIFDISCEENFKSLAIVTKITSLQPFFDGNCNIITYILLAISYSTSYQGKYYYCNALLRSTAWHGTLHCIV